MPPHDPDDDIYAGGYRRLMRFLGKRQIPFEDAAARLPPADVDLEALNKAIVPAPTQGLEETPRFSADRKWLELQIEFQGKSQLELLHGFLIAVSRRADPPAAALPLFHRIWEEQGHVLAAELPVRWLISTATTFADCGQTPEQRACGMGLSTLFDLVKLHDSERRASGDAGDTRRRVLRPKKRPPLAFDMDPYSLRGGDLDKVMLARLWALGEHDKTIRPLAVRMLRMVMSDTRSIFARMQDFKSEKMQ
ncbi:hypothetical protein [Ascidiaceihabitans sp.]|uniref:hypothetical protein n=1 Tax=Ascidiaceihabitans sp. TaxID=1872644 RepID=UPI003298C53B